MNRFPRVLGVRTGYDPDQVDLLVRRIEGTLGRGAPEGEPITADEIRDARFRTKLGGYHEIAVDFALEAFIVAIETRPTGADGRPIVPARRQSVPWPTAPQEQERAQRAEPPLRDPGAAAVARHPGATEWDPRGGGREPVAVARHPGAAEWEPVADGPPEPLGADEIEEHAVRVERAAFRPGRLGMGYNEDQVDIFLDRIVATLRGTTDQPLTPDEVRGARFATVLLRPGYAVGEVDEFLADLAGVLEARLGR
ncbi:DivIVA domain-containing protein [Streptosporangium sp. NPDC049644]|uniref:DivIVA domain-containing protein n=1 Tax=Streptosporangium sp. NPDC049644 TaxID=3155507 RepID=UPI003418B77D